VRTYPAKSGALGAKATMKRVTAMMPVKTTVRLRVKIWFVFIVLLSSAGDLAVMFR